MVPKDASITDLRISLVFRHCDNRWVKLNQYHYNMKLRGRRNQKRWTKVDRAPLPMGQPIGTSPSCDANEPPAKRCNTQQGGGPPSVGITNMSSGEEHGTGNNVSLHEVEARPDVETVAPDSRQ